MTAERRRIAVRERVLLFGEVNYGALAREFGVSEMTIRRDIESLEDQGVVRRVTGGAIALDRKVDEPPFHARASEASDAKAAMALEVVNSLQSGQTVILDSGSTVLAVARAIRARALGLTIITPSILVAIELADEPGTTVLVTGGELRAGDLSLVGPESIDSLNRYNADVFVMGVAGVDEARGYTDYHRGESAVKKSAIAVSDRVIVVADRGKVGRSALVSIAPIEGADLLVTDAPDDDPVVQDLRRRGVEICIAKPVGASRGSDLAGGSEEPGPPV